MLSYKWKRAADGNRLKNRTGAVYQKSSRRNRYIFNMFGKKKAFVPSLIPILSQIDWIPNKALKIYNFRPFRSQFIWVVRSLPRRQLSSLSKITRKSSSILQAKTVLQRRRYRSEFWYWIFIVKLKPVRNVFANAKS